MPVASKTRKSLTETVKHVKAAPPRKTLWTGPGGEGPQGGITQGLLNRFLSCRWRFGLLMKDGLKPADAFSKSMHYGQMWHTCEEALAGNVDWKEPLKAYCYELCKQYPMQQEQVDHWYNVCKTQFPLYVEYWSKQQDVKDRTPLLQEQIFDVPYKLPFSGRIVRLRGKFDAVDLIGKGKTAGIYLQENKTKGDIKEAQLQRQLSFDLQTCTYLTALLEAAGEHEMFAYDSDERSRSRWGHPIRGVRYNVVRRPLSGGKGTIKRHEPSKSNPDGESKESFYARLGQYIKDDPQYYFMRWKVEISQGDIQRFKDEFLDPCLEQLCDWWACLNEGQVDSCISKYQNMRMPFGIYNPLAETGATELDEYLASGSTIGLQHTDDLFPELK